MLILNLYFRLLWNNSSTKDKAYGQKSKKIAPIDGRQDSQSKNGMDAFFCNLFPTESCRRLVCSIKIKCIHKWKSCNFVNNFIKQIKRKRSKAGCHNVF